MKAKRTVLLIHGLWVTPFCWEPFRRFYENLGHHVLAPAWPGLEGEVADMRRDPSGIDGIGAGEVVAHYARIVQDLSEPPIIVGHSYGGLIAQLLIDRGLGAAAVAIDSIPPKGIFLLPVSTYFAFLPAISNPFSSRGTFIFTFEQFWRTFCNTLPESEARKAYETQIIPAPRRAILQALFANVTCGGTTEVNFKNPSRAPLLIIGGRKDLVIPASLSRKTFRKHSASSCLTSYMEFPGRSHCIIAEQGWLDVADYALTWALAHAYSRI